MSVDTILQNAKVATLGISWFLEALWPATTRNAFMNGNLCPCLKQMLPRPRIDLLQERPDFLPKRSERIFDPDGHFGKHLSFDKAISFKFPQLLRQYFLRDPRHVLPEDFESERLFAVHKPPENNWFPTAPDEDEQFLDWALADNAFSAHVQYL